MALSMPLSSSCANMLTMVESDAEIYNLMYLFLTGRDKIGGCVKYFFISSKAL